MIEKEFILIMFSNNEFEATELFKSFSNEANDDEFIDVEDVKDKNRRIKRKAEKIIYEITGKKDIDNIKEDKEKRDRVIIELKNSLGLSIRKIAEILDVNRGAVYNILKRNR